MPFHCCRGQAEAPGWISEASFQDLRLLTVLAALTRRGCGQWATAAVERAKIRSVPAPLRTQGSALQSPAYVEWSKDLDKARRPAAKGRSPGPAKALLHWQLTEKGPAQEPLKSDRTALGLGM